MNLGKQLIYELIVSMGVVCGCSHVLIGGSEFKDEGESTENEVDTKTVSETEFDSETDTTDNDNPEIIECETVDDYDSLGGVCYIDSINGNDTNSGLSADEPLKTQAAVAGKSCVVARFKRGSLFNEKLMFHNRIKVYTNYGEGELPQFRVPSTSMSGPVFQSVGYSGITLDGLYFAGARSDGTIENILGGICVFLGADSKVLNSEITSCEIGAMLAGAGSSFKGNYVHDLIIGVQPNPEGDPNNAGGAAGIFVTASNIEVAYNTFVNCKDKTETGSSCDGGAVEIISSACDTVSEVNIHHNFSYNNCGFLEIATTSGNCKGTVENTKIYNNISIDSAWMGFFQVNNTDFENLHYYNNTNVHHKSSENAGTLWIIFNETSSGMTGGELVPGTVFLTNNLYIFDDFVPLTEPMDTAFGQKTNLIIYTDNQDPKVVNVKGTSFEDFFLTKDSPAVDAGSTVSGNTLDFVHNIVPNPGGITDIGAFEFNSKQEICLPPKSPVKVNTK